MAGGKGGARLRPDLNADATLTFTASPDVKVNNRAWGAFRIDDMWNDFLPQVGGSKTVLVNKLGFARCTDLKITGTPIITCSPDVIVGD